jgi:hypothetical protein
MRNATNFYATCTNFHNFPVKKLFIFIKLSCIFFTDML